MSLATNENITVSENSNNKEQWPSSDVNDKLQTLFNTFKKKDNRSRLGVIKFNASRDSMHFLFLIVSIFLAINTQFIIRFKQDNLCCNIPIL